jgi:death-on-curing protein
MMPVIYIRLQDALNIHKLTVEKSGGGNTDILNSDQMDSVLSHIQNDDYYPEFADKLTHLFWGVCMFHCFCDGNKRIAISLGAMFLLINGYQTLSAKFTFYMENISYHVAAGNIEKDLLHKIIVALLEGSEEDESLKLEIFNAIRVR